MNAAAKGVYVASDAALSALMPMYMILDPPGRIRECGPTLAKVSESELRGVDFFSAFEVRRPLSIQTFADLAANAGRALHLRMYGEHGTLLRAIVAEPHYVDGSILMNLSFGIHVSEAVAQHGLTIADFAATDLAVEMLYLIEAKSAAMQESRRLNAHLDKARLAAEESSLTDALTGLPNRRGIVHRLAPILASGTPFALMLIDLDHFKDVNDTKGHAAGDRVLIEVARRFQETLRAGDMVARLGGDEFLAILPFMDEPPPVNEIGERLIEATREPIAYEESVCRVAASIGVAIVGKNTSIDIDDIQRRADEALYRSKRDGRARISVEYLGEPVASRP